jgi:hypothetical protein
MFLFCGTEVERRTYCMRGKCSITESLLQATMPVCWDFSVAETTNQLSLWILSVATQGPWL